MTDEERQKLIAALRRKAGTGAVRVPMCGEAGDELERLAALVDRLHGENDWLRTALRASQIGEAQSPPPRPDASVGLIEAAEMAEQCANDSLSENGAMHLRDFATKLRAVAAVRNNPEAFAKLKALRPRYR